LAKESPSEIAPQNFIGETKMVQSIVHSMKERFYMLQNKAQYLE